MEKFKQGLWVVLDNDGYTMIGQVSEDCDGIVVMVNDMFFFRTENNIRPLTNEILDQLKKEVTDGI